MKDKIRRRSFLRRSALSSMLMGLTGLSLGARTRSESPEARLERLTSTRPAVGSPVIGMRDKPIEQVKVGVIGLGNRGSFHARLLGNLYPDKAKVTAICDVRPERVEATLAELKEKGQNPATYSGDPDAWREMVKRDDIDLIVVVTPWDLHTPMCVEGMRQGKHVATEIPAALTLEECWELVNTSEETQRHCVMLENVCYGDEELWVLNMAQEGVFGTLTHAEAAYIHNLREHMFSQDYYYNQWRIRFHEKIDANLYPCHGLGPVSQYLDILRGDAYDTLVSMSSREASLTEVAKTVAPSNEFYGRTGFAHGDMNSSLIKTKQGRTILVQHDVVTPRPYSRINALGGTKGYHEGYPSRLALEEHGHDWVPDEVYQEYREKYRHPIWETLKEGIEKNGGHGGMDFVMMYRLIDCLNNGWPVDMDVYDAAAWSAVVPLSRLSVEVGSAPVKFPDFSRGAWKEGRKLGIFAYM